MRPCAPFGSAVAIVLRHTRCVDAHRELPEARVNPRPFHADTGWFRRFAHGTAEAVGRPQAFVVALAIVVAWGATGPMFHYSDTWQLVINTGTTIVTFLMVFLIQNTQNRDAQAMQLKLDELIRANKKARNTLLNAETMSDEDLAKLQNEFEALRLRVVAMAGTRSGDSDD